MLFLDKNKLLISQKIFVGSYSKCHLFFDDGCPKNYFWTRVSEISCLSDNFWKFNCIEFLTVYYFFREYLESSPNWKFHSGYHDFWLSWRNLLHPILVPKNFSLSNSLFRFQFHIQQAKLHVLMIWGIEHWRIFLPRTLVAISDERRRILVQPFLKEKL